MDFVAVMDQVLARGQEAPLFHGHVAGHLDHPRLIGMGCDAGHVDLPTVTRLLSKNPAVLVRRGGKLDGIVTRFDVMRYVTGAWARSAGCEPVRSPPDGKARYPRCLQRSGRTVVAYVHREGAYAGMGAG